MSSLRLLLLCHDGGWERLYQAGSCAATAASMGWQVDAVFYFEALEKLLGARLDEVSCEPRDPAREAALRARIDELGTQGPAALLASARASGSMRLLACSASLALLGLDAARVRDQIDEVVGWPTTISLMERADRVLYL